MKLNVIPVVTDALLLVTSGFPVCLLIASYGNLILIIPLLNNSVVRVNRYSYNVYEPTMFYELSLEIDTLVN